MSKIKDLQLRDDQNKGNNTTLPAVPADIADELAAFGAAANQNLNKLLGTLLTYKKEVGAPEGGRYRYGRDKVELPIGTRLVALMNEIRHGHRKWQSGRIAGEAIFKVIDVPLLNRQALGDNEDDEWPVSEITGKQEDPWLHYVYIPLATLDGKTFYTFSTKSYYGRCAAYLLMDEYKLLARQHVGQYPIIELGSEIIPPTKRGRDDVPAPKFEIVGWTGRPQLALADGGGADDGAPDDGPPDDGVPPADDVTDFNDAVSDRVPF